MVTRLTYILFLFTVLALVVSADDFELEQLHWFYSDSSNLLYSSVYSPGDLNGDGLSEIFAREIKLPRRTLVFSGGSQSHADPVKVFDGFLFKWVDDINGDGFRDFVMGDYTDPDMEKFEIWFGCDDFLSKETYDLTIWQSTDTLCNFGVGGSSSNNCSIHPGDINGDGYNDLIIPSLDGSYGYAGRFSIYHGGPEFDSIADQVLTFYHGDDKDGFMSGTALGDINGDGLVDLGFSIMVINEQERFESKLAIIYGKPDLDTTVDLTVYTPFGGNTFGELIKPMGDLNQDGYDDFVVGGQIVYPCIFYGGDPFDTIPVILGDTANDYTRGDRVANIGDINNDGWDDIGVGFPAINYQMGRVYIHLGEERFDSEIDLTITHDFFNPIAGDELGYSVGPAGDFNGDGVDDFAITSRQNIIYSGRTDSGRVYIVGWPQPTAVDDDDDLILPEIYDTLYQNYPNPFNQGTVIEYYISADSLGDVEITIFNLLGQKVRSLTETIRTSGRHELYWNGRDNSGNSLPSGIYFYQLKTGKEVLSKKMIYLK